MQASRRSADQPEITPEQDQSVGQADASRSGCSSSSVSPRPEADVAVPRTGVVSLRALLPDATFLNTDDLAVSDVHHDSRCVTPGGLFAALPGTRQHGLEHLPEALLNGAAAVLTDRSPVGRSVPCCIVPDARRAYGALCHALHFQPSTRLGVAGVTGTNGKSTTTWLIQQALSRLGRTCGWLGTIQYSDGVVTAPAALTTPDPRTMASWLGRMVARGTQYAALELSSHALEQERTAGLQLDVAVITNVTRDHLDYHPNLTAYRAAKARIAELLKPQGVLVYNCDDPGAVATAELAGKSRAEVSQFRFSLTRPVELTGKIQSESLQGMTLELRSAGGEVTQIETPLFGQHNAENLLAAAAVLLQWGLSLSEIGVALGACSAPPGRLQRVSSTAGGEPGDFAVFVDYAHTPDAIQRVINTVRQLSFGRVIVVLGAGGDRDRQKRPEMGAAAAAADLIYITSDNPRSEDPQQIAEELRSGISSQSAVCCIELDRRTAIQEAIGAAHPGDVVLVLGKGHEREQIIGRTAFPFDDVSECCVATRSRHISGT